MPSRNKRRGSLHLVFHRLEVPAVLVVRIGELSDPLGTRLVEDEGHFLALLFELPDDAQGVGHPSQPFFALRVRKEYYRGSGQEYPSCLFGSGLSFLYTYIRIRLPGWSWPWPWPLNNQRGGPEIYFAARRRLGTRVGWGVAFTLLRGSSNATAGTPRMPRIPPP